MIRVSEYDGWERATLSDKEMTSQDALFDLVSRLFGETVVIFLGFGWTIQLDWRDKDGKKRCVSYFGVKDDVDFLLLEQVAKHYALSTHQCSADVRAEFRHDFRALAEKFIHA